MSSLPSDDFSRVGHILGTNKSMSYLVHKSILCHRPSLWIPKAIQENVSYNFYRTFLWDKAFYPVESFDTQAILSEDETFYSVVSFINFRN